MQVLARLGLPVFLVLALPAHAAVRRVPQDFTTITAALAAAAPGDSVLVAAGSYSPSANGETFPLQLTTNGVRLIGAGSESTTLDAQATAGVVHCDATLGGRVSGFRITGGRNPQGGGIRLDHGDFEIDHNRIDHNGASDGGAGISLQNSPSPWIHHNLIVDNFTTTATDVHSVRYNQLSAGVFEHNLIAHSDGNGLLTGDTSAPSIRHNIFYQNGSPSPRRGRGICWLSTGTAAVFHNLFFQNQVAALLWLGGGGDFGAAAANAFDPMDQVYGNLEADPLFVNPGAGDFHLQPGSPAIDAGDPALPHDPDGTIADIGPYYTHVLSVPPAPRSALRLAVSPNPIRDAADVTFSLPARDRVRLDVLDVSGRLVRTLVDRVHEPGTHRIRWSRFDDASAKVGPGVYWVMARTRDAARSAAVVVIE